MTRLPEWARALELSPHPEGGWYRETWRSSATIPADALPAGYPAARSAGTSILFLLVPGQESAWHRVRGAEIWLHHRGGAVELEIGGTGPEPSQTVTHRVGADVDAGEQPQAVVPEGCWQRARVVGAESGLVGCIVVPGFDFDDFQLLD